MRGNREGTGPGSSAATTVEATREGRDLHRRIAAITRMQTCEVGPGQQYALRAREASPESRPSQRGDRGQRDRGWVAKLAADEPNSHGVEWLRHSDKYRRMACS